MINIRIIIISIFILSFTMQGNSYVQIKEKAMKKYDSLKTDDKLSIIAGLPVNYPKDIPTPLNSKCKGYFESEDGTTVTFESHEYPKIIYDTFKSEIEKIGYIEDSLSTMMSESGGVASWKKIILDDHNKYERSLMLARDIEKNITEIVISYSKLQSYVK